MAEEEFDSTGIWVPIISEILGREVERGKHLTGFYEPAADWLSLILTLASALLQKGYVVNVTTTSTPPRKMKRIINRANPEYNESNPDERLLIGNIYTWQTGRKSDDEPEAADSLSLANASIDFGATWLRKSITL